MTAHRHVAGLTLIEVLASLLILATLAAAAVSLLTRVGETHREAAARRADLQQRVDAIEHQAIPAGAAAAPSVPPARIEAVRRGNQPRRSWMLQVELTQGGTDPDGAGVPLWRLVSEGREDPK